MLLGISRHKTLVLVVMVGEGREACRKAGDEEVDRVTSPLRKKTQTQE